MKHKIVELAYWSIDGTHFLATPNLVIGTSAPTATDHHGKKFNIVAFSKDWEQCVAQAKAQLHFSLVANGQQRRKFRPTTAHHMAQNFLP